MRPALRTEWRNRRRTSLFSAAEGAWPAICTEFRRVRFGSLVLVALLVPSQASAQEIVSRRVDTAVLTTGATLINLAGMLPAVGSGIGVAYELPNRRWAITGTVIGAAQVTFGALSIASGLAENADPWLSAYGAVTALMGIGNLILGMINLFKSNYALRQIDFLDQPYAAD